MGNTKQQPDFSIYTSSSLTSHYVFYERLITDRPGADDYERRKRLYESVNKRLVDFKNHYSDLERIGWNMISFAELELDKEVHFLRSVFQDNVEIDLNYQDPKSLSKIIRAFNRTLNLSKNFKRNVERIKTPTSNGKRQINIASFVDTYLSSAWDSQKNVLEQRLKQDTIAAKETGRSLNDVLNENVAKMMDEVVHIALENMFQSETFKDSDTGSEDYRMLLEDLRSYSNESEALIQELKEIYKIDETIAYIEKQLINEKNMSGARRKLKTKDFSKKIAAQFQANHYGRGGLSLEALEQYIAQLVVKSSNGRITMEGYRTGATGVKADNIYVFDAKGLGLEEDLDMLAHAQIDRINMTKTFKEVNQRMSQLDDGWIVYSSAKNYTAQADGEFKGFAAGDPVQAEKMGDIIGDPAKIGAIYQTIPNAIGANHEGLWDSIRASLASDIAYFLFDDFYAKTKNNTNITTGNSLHVFDLDGILVPFSLLIYRMGRAMIETASLPTRIISVDIKKPTDILYPKLVLENGKDVYAGQEFWDKQRDDAIDNTTIAFHFFKDFFTMIRQEEF